MISTVGGGLCQLSNALYETALGAGFEIVERHAHSRVVPGSRAVLGRDATVFWNYVDLRFRSPHAFRIEARMSERRSRYPVPRDRCRRGGRRAGANGAARRRQ